MISGEYFIITSLQPWDLEIGFNAKDIALEISKNNKVLFINTPLDYKTLYKGEDSPEYRRRKEVINKKVSPIRQISPSLWVVDLPFAVYPINPLPDGFIFDFANKINNRKIYRYVNKVIKELDFKNYYLFIDNDIYRSYYAADFLKPKVTIYYRRDNLVDPFWNKHYPRIEALLCKKSDIVTANSLELANAVRKHNNRCYDVGQGVDLSDYDYNKNYPLPLDLASVPKPIIGYVGFITSLRLDADLMYDLANEFKEYSFVMVGMEDEIFKKHKIHSAHNIYFLGQKLQTETLNYMANFNICMNPQAITPMTIGNYPRKIDEYLALGKPTLATRTETMKLFEEYVWNCDNIEDYIKAIKDIISKMPSESSHDNVEKQIIEKRVSFAKSHTWTNSVKKIYEAINENYKD